jgi:NAD(P)-dependent dehydrogenase (short-subunit alcohol dehydrogenase family)
VIHTAMTPPLLDFRRVEDELVAKTPWGRLGVPNDVDDVVDFLCSELARFVTGNLVVDGGMTLHGAGVDGVLDRMKALLAGANDPMAGLRG